MTAHSCQQPETLLIVSRGTKGLVRLNSFIEQFSEMPTRMPEPSSLALLGTGLAVLPFRPRRRRGG
jgi:PEP-CTERM motif